MNRQPSSTTRLSNRLLPFVQREIDRRNLKNYTVIFLLKGSLLIVSVLKILHKLISLEKINLGKFFNL